MTAILFTRHPYEKRGIYMYSVPRSELERLVTAYPLATQRAMHDDVEGVAPIVDAFEKRFARLPNCQFSIALLPEDRDDEPVAVLIAMLKFWGVRFRQPKILYSTCTLPADWSPIVRAGSEDEV